RRRGAPQRFLDVCRQRAEAHAGDCHWNGELERLLGEACAEHRARCALLAIALQWIARQRCTEESEIVEMRQVALRTQTTDLVQSRRGGAVDIVESRTIVGRALLAGDVMQRMGRRVHQYSCS